MLYVRCALHRVFLCVFSSSPLYIISFLISHGFLSLIVFKFKRFKKKGRISVFQCMKIVQFTHTFTYSWVDEILQWIKKTELLWMVHCTKIYFIRKENGEIHVIFEDKSPTANWIWTTAALPWYTVCLCVHVVQLIRKLRPHSKSSSSSKKKQWTPHIQTHATRKCRKPSLPNCWCIRHGDENDSTKIKWINPKGTKRTHTHTDQRRKKKVSHSPRSCNILNFLTKRKKKKQQTADITRARIAEDSLKRLRNRMGSCTVYTYESPHILECVYIYLTLSGNENTKAFGIYVIVSFIIIIIRGGVCCCCCPQLPRVRKWFTFIE